MKRWLVSIAISVALSLSFAAPALADSPVHFGQIYLDGALVRTLLPPAATPQDGTDAFYMVPGTGGVAAVGPGDAGYHGGFWKVYVVSWNVAQRPLTSQSAILAAQAAGDITVTRNAALDFRCPIQP
ncbi:MAG: hypothetical protein ABJB39_07740 [Chloroflexota bacterium]